MRTRRAFAATWVAAVIALGVESGARAQTGSTQTATSASSEGRVLSIEDDDIIVDAEPERGAPEGTILQIYRPIRLKHPVTGRAVVDRYRIGELKLTQVRDRIALGRAVGKLLRNPAVGDVVVRAEAAPPDPVASKPSPSAVRADLPLAEGTAELNALFESLRGTSLTRRVKAYERYARERPASPHARTLMEEAAALRELIATRTAEKDPTRQAPAGPEPPVALNFVAPEATVNHAALSIGIEIGGPVIGAVLSSRNAGEVAYRTLPMSASGDGYFVVSISADRLTGREVQYFVEAIVASGDAVAVAGTAESPARTRIDAVPRAEPRLAHRSSLSVVSDYADYNRLRGNDRAFQTEGTFGMRFAEVGVRALRTGFGVYRGVGGSVEELDRLGRSPLDVGFTYGHIEGEFGLKPAFSIIARAVVGLGDDGTSGGAQLHFRIGSDLSTNLAVGGEVLGGVGLRGITELQLRPLARFPVLVRSEVTNQPAGASSSSDLLTARAGRTDIGIRAIVQVGWRPVEPLLFAIRGSYQGRTIDHSGPGFGAAVEYRW